MKSSFSVSIFWRIAVIVFATAALFYAPVVFAESQSAPAAFAPGDIQFCPKGKPYLHSSCSDLRTKMQDAITDARNAAAAGISGTIFVEGGQSYSNDTNDNSGGIILVDGFNYGTSLTIQGGVGSGTTTFVRQLYLVNNFAVRFTLADVSLSSSISGDHGLNVTNNSGSSITLRNVNAITNQVSGIRIYEHSGDISLLNVNANNNGNTGIYVYDLAGKLSFKNVSANENGSDNIYFWIISGDISLDTVNANNSISGHGIYAIDCQGKKGVTITNVTAGYNGKMNILVAEILNNVSINGVSANKSAEQGISLIKIRGSKGVSLNNTTASGNILTNINIGNISGNVILTGVYADESVTSDGISIEDVGGSKGITIKNVTAEKNYAHNIYASNIAGNAALSTVTANNSTDYMGIFLNVINGTKGVTMKDIVASDNYDRNIMLDNIAGNVGLSGITAERCVSSSGILIVRAGGIKGVTMKGIKANANDLENIALNYITGNVTLSAIEANDGMGVGSTGLYLYHIEGTKGVTMKQVSANNNQACNVFLSTIAGNVNMSDIYANSSQHNDGITLYNINGSKGINLKNIIANDNLARNVYAENIAGNTSLTNVQANASIYYQGIYLKNIQGIKGVAIKGAAANNNHLENLYIEAVSGNVSMNIIESQNSAAQEGILLQNILGIKGVTLKQVTSDNNYFDNLYLDTITGNVNLTSVQASGSQNLNGIYIGNVSGSKGVTLKDVTANTNDLNNIQIQYVNPGNVVFNNVQGTGCITGSGLYVNILAGSLLGVNGTFSGNPAFGIFTNEITGLIALRTVTADSNGIHGAKLASDTNQLVCSSGFNNNTSYAIDSTTTDDSLTLNNVVMTGNGLGNDPNLTNTTQFFSTKCAVIPVLVP